MRVFVRFPPAGPAAAPLEIECRGADTVGTLKTRVDKTGLAAAERLALFWTGVELDPLRTLDSYCVAADAVLILAPAPRPVALQDGRLPLYRVEAPAGAAVWASRSLESSGRLYEVPRGALLLALAEEAGWICVKEAYGSPMGTAAWTPVTGIAGEPALVACAANADEPPRLYAVTEYPGASVRASPVADATVVCQREIGALVIALERVEGWVRVMHTYGTTRSEGGWLPATSLQRVDEVGQPCAEDEWAAAEDAWRPEGVPSSAGGAASAASAAPAVVQVKVAPVPDQGADASPVAGAGAAAAAGAAGRTSPATGRRLSGASPTDIDPAMDPNKAPNCQRCGKQFGWFRRKKLCTRCGLSLCGDCSGSKSSSSYPCCEVCR